MSYGRFRGWRVGRGLRKDLLDHLVDRRFFHGQVCDGKVGQQATGYRRAFGFGVFVAAGGHPGEKLTDRPRIPSAGP